MLSRISLVLLAVAVFGSAMSVEAGKPNFQSISKKLGQSNGGNNGNNQGNNQGNNGNNQGNNQGNNGNNQKKVQGNPVARQVGLQILNQFLNRNNGGFNGNNGNWNNGNGGNWNNGNNGNNGNCHNNNGPVIGPAGGQPPVIEEPAPIEQPQDVPQDLPIEEGAPADPLATDPGTIEVSADGGETPAALRSIAPGSLAKGVDLQAKLVKFAVATGANGKQTRVVFAEIATVGGVPFNGTRTLTIEHDSAPGQQPPTIIASAKVPAIAAGQTFKFQKALPANISLSSLRLRLTLSAGDANVVNDSISSRE